MNHNYWHAHRVRIGLRNKDKRLRFTSSQSVEIGRLGLEHATRRASRCIEGAQRAQSCKGREDRELGVWCRKPSDGRETKATARSKTGEGREQLKPVLVRVYTSTRIDASVEA